ncbi:class I SAM-dependent methyltransferase [Roseobacter sp.]|uniref:class I SAM-dependent methyltransferase n=1 Tax=Roseobacter sp. TaxID=1907202 RepID=UPI00385FBE12
MNDAYWDAFFVLHRDLPREGPGEAAEVAWAAEIAALKPDARICDAACGPGADISALRCAAPDGHVTAMDKVEQFVEQARARHAGDTGVSLSVSDMSKIKGPYDMIWCAGALYFLGVTEGLRIWRDALAPGGVVVFSEVCWFTDDRPAEAVKLWEEYPAMTDAAGIADRVTAAGYETLATRRVSDRAWEDYFGPMDARIAALEPSASGALLQVLEEGRQEAACWRAHRDSFGYLLSVVRPDGV